MEALELGKDGLEVGFWHDGLDPVLFSVDHVAHYRGLGMGILMRSRFGVRIVMRVMANMVRVGMVVVVASFRGVRIVAWSMGVRRRRGMDLLPAAEAPDGKGLGGKARPLPRSGMGKGVPDNV